MRLNENKQAVLKIAARHSDLARLQAYRVGDALKARNPGLEIEYAFRASLGDINLNEPLWKMPEKGVFTEDFVRDLVEGTADLVVHSWKDLPTIPRSDTEIVATLPRADVRDLLLFRKDRLSELMGASAKTREIRILTSSPRRTHNLSGFFMEHLPFQPSAVAFEPVRGNIPTRLKKMLSQDVDGLIVAKAALDRLLAAPEAEFNEVQTVIRDVLAQSRFMVLPLSVNPTAAAQGALAVEINKANSEARRLLASIHCEETFACVQKERRILASHGGGCHQKIGVNVLKRPYGEITFLRGLTDAGVVLDAIDLVFCQGSFFEARGGRRMDNTSTTKQRGKNFSDKTLVTTESGRAVGTPIDEAKIFPRSGEDAAFFTREALPASSWSHAKEARYLWVARDTAWPEDFVPQADAIVWTAGLQTWKKLAARGVWVSGSSESLGESEPIRLEELTMQPQLNWLKLTHENAGDIAVTSSMHPCATYRLQPKQSSPDLRGRTHFFWMSGSSLDRALEIYPEIRSAHHASGPGHTHEHLRRVLGPGATISVHLGVDAWRQALLN